MKIFTSPREGNFKIPSTILAASIAVISYELRGDAQIMRKWVKATIILFTILASYRSFSQCATFSPIPSPVCSNAPFIALDPLVSPAGGTFYGAGVFTGTSLSFFNPYIAGPGTWTIGYTINPSCSVTITVTVTDFIQITPAPNLGTKYQMTSGTSTTLTVANPSFYSNFHWYENGFEVGTSNSLTVYRMGTFTVIADGPCGLKEKAELDVVCDCSAGVIDASTYANGYTFTTNRTGYVLSGLGTTATDFVFGGTITIQKGASLELSNAKVDFKACTKIIIEAGDGSTDGGKLIVSNTSELRGCDKWQGIIIKGNPSYDRGNKRHGELQIGADVASISDAYIAIYSKEGGIVSIQTTSFANNNTDVALINYPNYEYNPQNFNDNTFKGKWMHDDITSFCSLDTSYSDFVNSINRSTYSNSHLKQMIYLENVQDFNIYNSTFEGNNFLNDSNFITNAIELKHVKKINLGGSEYVSGSIVYREMLFRGYLNSGITAGYVSNENAVSNSPLYTHGTNYIFDRYFFDDSIVLNRGVVLNNCSTIVLGYVQSSPFNANQFLGMMHCGTHIENSENIYQYENLFNVASVTSSTGLSALIDTAIYYKNCDSIELNGTWMADIPYGGHFENCDSSSKIHDNELYNSTNGFYFKNCHDININTNTFNGCSNYSLQFFGFGGTLTSIEGNRFVDNNYGIIVSPQVNPISSSTTSNNGDTTTMNIDISCNYFKNNKYAIIGSRHLKTQGDVTDAASNKFDGNVEWNLVWEYNNDTINYFYKAGTMSDPDNSMLGQTSILINSYNSPYNVNALISSNNNACFSSLLKSFQKRPSGIETKIQTNNPVTNYLILFNCRKPIDKIECTNSIGEIFYLNCNSNLLDSYYFNTKDLPADIYIIHLNDQYLKFIKF